MQINETKGKCEKIHQVKNLFQQARMELNTNLGFTPSVLFRGIRSSLMFKKRTSSNRGVHTVNLGDSVLTEKATSHGQLPSPYSCSILMVQMCNSRLQY